MREVNKLRSWGCLVSWGYRGGENLVSDKVKTRLGYKVASPPVESFVNSSGLLENQENVKSRSDKGYHAVSPPYTGNYIPPKPNLTFINEQVESDYVDVVSNVASSDVKTVESKHKVKDTTAREKAVVNPQQKEYKEKRVIDSSCSRHMTGNKCYLTDYEDYDGGFVSFRDGKGRIPGKGKIKTGTLDFDDVYFCKEIKYNMFSVSQMCDKKNNVLFTNTECLVLSSNFKLLDESQVSLRVPRKDNIYSVDLNSVVPTGESARTMLVDSKLPTTFWAEAVNTAYYVLNRALVIKPYNKTPYQLIRRRPLLIDFMKPFGCPVTILNTRDHLGKFDGKADEGFFLSTLCSPVSTPGPSFPNTASPSPINVAVTPASTNAFEEPYDDEAVEEEVDINNVVSSYIIPDAPLTKFLKDHLKDQITSTTKELNKAFGKDVEAEDVDVHLYKSKIGLLMYLIASRPDITFAVCACARKSTTGGYFLDKRLISWQYKKQTIIANSTTDIC
nr:ribonuclease H-like domain-containing protein [Tanacetum cinerariifolium]